MSSNFIDIATYDVQEGYMYSGNAECGEDSSRATSYFTRYFTRSSWFSIGSVVLSKNNGNADFGSEWSVAISRSNDYLLNVTLRVRIPSVTLLPGNQYGATGTLRWTRNLMHNLIRSVSITFNDMVVQSLTSYHFDVWAEFTNSCKKSGYDNMIGNVDALIQPTAVGVPIPDRYLNLPIPFFFSRDSGVALPVSSIPYNEIRINFNSRSWSELLILDNSAAVASQTTIPVVPTDIATQPTLTNGEVYAWYGLVTDTERSMMQCERTIIIEQTQSVPSVVFNPLSNPDPTIDIRLSHSIKAIFFSVRNTTHSNIWSNYTTATPVSNATAVNFEPSGGAYDPISETTLTYENTERFSNVGSDILSLVYPYYFAPAIPTRTGFHMLPYSLDFYCLDPKGSTNFGKLSNVSVSLRSSPQALVGAAGTGAAGSGMNFPQTYQVLICAINNNIIKISNGSIGFLIM